MCYSGKCIWEQHSGDCGFPNTQEIRKKYPIPLCTIPDEEENAIDFDLKIKEVKEMLKQHKNNYNYE